MQNYNVKHEVESTIWTLNLLGEVDNQSILDSIYDYKRLYPKSRSSSIYAWHTDYDMYINNDRINQLLTTIENKVNIICNKVNHYTKIVESWAAIYNKDDFTVWHNHSVTTYSTVYYARADHDASKIVFEGGLELQPQTGMLVVFPGYLNHMVPRSISDNPRIIVASNLFLFRDKI